MDSKHSMRANLLDKLIEKIMMGEGFGDEESSEEMPEMGESEEIEGQENPKAQMKMIAIEAKPKKKLLGC
jgi:hypothetical protein